MPSDTSREEFDFQSLSQEVHGTLTVAKREFFANFFSVRLLIIVIIFTLIVMAGAWGFASLGAEAVENIIPKEQLEEKVFISAYLLDLNNSGKFDDILLRTIDIQGEPVSDFTITTTSGDENLGFYYSDQDGVVLYPDMPLGNYTFQGMYPGLSFADLSKMVQTQAHIDIGSNSTEETTSINVIYDFSGVDIESGDLSILPGFQVQVVDSLGEPIPDVEIFANSESMGETNENGILYTIDLDNGRYDITIDRDGETSYIGHTMVERKESQDPFDMLKDKSPDEVLLIVSSFVTLFGSLFAVILSMDGITRERLGNTLDFLLCRPLSKTSILMGKFIGITFSLVLPFSCVLILGTMIIGAISGENPTPRLVLGFIALTAVFMSIWILLLLIYSSLAKTTTTSILAGIATWFVFSFIWDLLIFLTIGMEESSSSVKWGLLNPTRAYTYTLISEAARVGGIDGETDLLGIPNWAPHLAMAIWFFGLLFLAIIIFKRKTSE